MLHYLHKVECEPFKLNQQIIHVGGVLHWFSPYLVRRLQVDVEKEEKNDCWGEKKGFAFQGSGSFSKQNFRNGEDIFALSRSLVCWHS